MKVLLLIVLSLTLCQGIILSFFSKVLDDIVSALGPGQSTAVNEEVPSFQDLLNGGRHLLIELPFELASGVLNKMCSSAVDIGLIKSRVKPAEKWMSFMLITRKGSFSAPLNRVRRIWAHPEFHKNRTTVIFVTGWLTDLSNEMETIDNVSAAYLARGDSNFVALNPGKYINTLYTWSALSTELIGRRVAKGLVHLLDYVEVKNIHLIGHSLGAHIVGFCGRCFKSYTGARIPRITGLDPARPCFNKGHKLSGLQRGDAAFVDVIHSNPGALGKPEPLGDADFYPNGLQSVPPGCLSIVCAHERSWRYYAESVYRGNENNFMAVRCDSMANLENGECRGKADYPMGYAVPQNIKGIFFLEVNSKSPFGKNSQK